ncbi:Site-specific recombinase XerD [Paenibacillus algorifonticola]|uniref:Site-specific recombinase XerD n=1 Tax=Paenibacillus algorifonticola TaxID=684063 RepID=A0A1I2GWV5_9BACL|nr:site-specific integrase [Paenibacillus algorifonticola]SFF22414.1 Site-specific recombinase XerD [Paenibacillus algorifonticola]
MAYYEHKSGNKYKLVAKDPDSVGWKRKSTTIEVPAEIAKNERKLQLYLASELLNFEKKVSNGEIIKTKNISLSDFVQTWDKGYAESNMGEYTQFVNNNFLRIYILPKFGAMRIDKITTLHLVNFFAELVKKNGQPMATNTKLNIYKAAKSVFDAAVSWNIIMINPIDGVKRPTAQKKERRALRLKKKSYTRKETTVVILALFRLPKKWMLYFLGVLLGGFRRGEFLATEWEEVYFDERCGIDITKQITFDKEGKKIEGELKTDESEAFVPMPRWYMDALREYYLEWKKEKLLRRKWKGGKKNYIFHKGWGEMYFPGSATKKWSDFLQDNNLPIIRLHDLRHTTAMLLRESGADIKTIQERLRHARTATTTDIYMHKSEMVSRDAADRLESLNPMAGQNSPQHSPGAAV